MSICSYKIISKGNIIEKDSNTKSLIVYNKPLEYHLNIRKYNGYLWNKMFKAELLTNIRLDENIYYCEDELFVTQYIQKCKKICYSPKSLYNYIQRNNSGSSWSTWSEKKITILKAKEKQIKLLSKYGFLYYKDYYISYFYSLNDIKHRFNKDIISSKDLKKIYDNIIKNKVYSFKEKIVCFAKFRLFALYNIIRIIAHKLY